MNDTSLEESEGLEKIISDEIRRNLCNERRNILEYEFRKNESKESLKYDWSRR